MSEELKNINNCCVDLETLLSLEKRAIEDLKNGTHNIGQEEVITIIREFIRCKNDLSYYKNTGKLVRNKRSNKRGIILREFETGQIQVLERIEPYVINTHDSFNTLEVEDE